MENRINQILNITPEQEERLLAWMDNYIRFPDADILLALKNGLEEKPWKTEEEKLYIFYMVGFCKGSDRAMQLLNMLGLFDNVGVDPAEKKLALEKINKLMDNAIGKEKIKNK